MRTPLPLVGAAVLVLLGLTACDPGGAEPAGSDDPAAEETEGPAQIDVPDDAVFVLVAVATAPGGVTADVALVVHASLPFDAPAAAPALDATLAWCAGEVDADVLAMQGYSFTAIDITVTPRSGEWPQEAALVVWPRPDLGGDLVVATSGLRQVEVTSGEPGAYVPHCRQPVLVGGQGLSGTVHLGLPGDVAGSPSQPPFTAWSNQVFGVGSELPDGVPGGGIVLSDCAAAPTELGLELGVASGDDWEQKVEDSFCGGGRPIPLAALST
jgi:hypothetical protein